MAQTLIRILPHDWWTLQLTSDGRLMGRGYLLALWALYGLYWLLRHRRTKVPTDEQVPGIIAWAVAGGVVAFGPYVFPDLARQGIPIYGYGFMLFVGFLAGAATASRRARRVGLQGERIWDMGLWLFLSGIVGARLFYILEYHDRLFAGTQGLETLKAAVNLPEGGLIFYGGLLTAIGVFCGFCWFLYRRQGVRPLLLADVLIPSLFLGLAFGRIGCFLNGCCYGDPCSLPWAVTFPQQSAAFAAVGPLPLHPTQLYSSINALVLAVLSGAYFRYRQRDGAVLACGLLAYAVTRFLIEWLRGDEPGQLGTPLTFSQWISVGLFLGALVYAAWLWRRPAPSNTDLAAE